MPGKFSIIEKSRAYLAKVRSNPGYVSLPIGVDQAGVTITPTVPYPRLLQTVTDVPLSTRRGTKVEPDLPFYESDPERIAAMYAAALAAVPANARNAHLLYADLQAIQPPGLEAIFPDALREEEIRVTYSAVPWRMPNALKAHAKAAKELFIQLKKLNVDPVTGEVENNATPRLNDRQGSHFDCQLARYLDQVGTNITVDWDSGAKPMGSDFLRQGPERPQSGKLPALTGSVLANTFGTAVMFFHRDLKSIVYRCRNVAKTASVQERGFHCTVSGVLEPIKSFVPPTDRDPKKPTQKTLLGSGVHDSSFFRGGTEYEIYQETGLVPGEYLLFPIAYARELPRAGKPQLFYAAIALVDQQTFKDRLMRAAEREEYVGDADGAARSTDLLQDLLPEAFTYEGWACAELAETFVRVNEARLTELVAGA